MKIWLDDQREPPDASWKLVKSTDEFLYLLSVIGTGSVTDVSFDYDLGLSASGYDCAKLLVQYCFIAGIQLPRLSCHSQNPVGRGQIERLIEEAEE